ncbi:hypothetical protein C8R43DRAFT_1018174 [Mycena crocata]|nr:hypothetical protein C8R43DRAFT_1018174 [Mycena crocata]
MVPDSLSVFVHQPLFALMHSRCLSLSPSSHASSILRAVIVNPTPSTPSAITVPVNLPAGSARGPSCCTPTSPPYSALAYKLFGLDDSPIGSSDVESTTPAYERLDPLVLPTPPPGPLYHFTKQPRDIQEYDVFGPVHRPFQPYAQRQVDARLAARAKHLRTRAWIKRVHRDAVRGILIAV